MAVNAMPIACESVPIPFWNEYLRPWKLGTYSIGLSLLIAGSFYYQAPDWGIPISIIMSFFTYLTAGWSLRVIVERRWRKWPAMLFATWWCIDGCYALYWSAVNPAALELMRDANWPASLGLYWTCGLIWYWNGTLREFMHHLDAIWLLNDPRATDWPIRSSGAEGTYGRCRAGC